MPETLRRLTGFAVGVVVLANLWRAGSLRPSPEDSLEPRPPPSVRAAAPFRFREEAAALGLDYRHALYYPNPNAGSYLPLMALPPSIAVADLDGDGFYDIYVTQPDPRLPNKLFHNLGGQRFEEIGARVGLTKPTAPTARDADSVALFVDLDHDGRPDLVQSRFGCHTIFMHDPATFAFHEERARFGGYCSNPKGVNFADFDRDGFVDLVFANYYPDDAARLVPAAQPRLRLRGRRLLGRRERGPVRQRATASSPADGVLLAQAGPTHGHAQAVGVSDVDGDGFPDVYVASDYSYDGLFFAAAGGRAFTDVTEPWIAPPRARLLRDERRLRRLRQQRASSASSSRRCTSRRSCRPVTSFGSASASASSTSPTSAA